MWAEHVNMELDPVSFRLCLGRLAEERSLEAVIVVGVGDCGECRRVCL